MSAQRVMSDHAAAAKCIRQELKKDFPKDKFSVTSQYYSMGNSVNINWTDGPDYKSVEKIYYKYQYECKFNGIEDSYKYGKRTDVPQAKFVIAQRRVS